MERLTFLNTNIQNNHWRYSFNYLVDKNDDRIFIKLYNHKLPFLLFQHELEKHQDYIKRCFNVNKWISYRQKCHIPPS